MSDLKSDMCEANTASWVTGIGLVPKEYSTRNEGNQGNPKTLIEVEIGVDREGRRMLRLK